MHLIYVALVLISLSRANWECGRVTTTSQGSRSILQYLPKSVCDDINSSGIAPQVVPLLIAIHCYGCSADSWLKALKADANKFGFAVAAPVGISRSWNSNPCCGEALQTNSSDKEFILRAIHRFLQEPTAVVFFSPTAIFVAGFSNGGFMTSKLALEESNYFLGASPMAGHIYDLERSSGGMNILIHHNTMDEFVRPGGCCSSGTQEQRRCCCNISTNSKTCITTDEIFLKWVEINNCSSGHENYWLGRVQCHVGKDCNLGDSVLCLWTPSKNDKPPYHSKWSRGFEGTSWTISFFALNILDKLSTRRRRFVEFFTMDAATGNYRFVPSVLGGEPSCADQRAVGRYCLTTLTEGGVPTASLGKPNNITFKAKNPEVQTKGGLPISMNTMKMVLTVLLVLSIAFGIRLYQRFIYPALTGATVDPLYMRVAVEAQSSETGFETEED